MAIRKISDERWDKLVTKRASEGYIIHNLPVTSSRQILKITHTKCNTTWETSSQHFLRNYTNCPTCSHPRNFPETSEK